METTTRKRRRPRIGEAHNTTSFRPRNKSQFNQPLPTNKKRKPGPFNGRGKVTKKEASNKTIRAIFFKRAKSNYKTLLEFPAFMIHTELSDHFLKARIVKRRGSALPDLLITKLYKQDGDLIETTKLGRLSIDSVDYILEVTQKYQKFLSNI